MSIGKPRIHMICGFCGCNKELSFKVVQNEKMNIEGEMAPVVYITCGNCGTLSSLDEVIVEKRG